MIYVASIKNKSWIKVGFAEDVCKRVSQLQTGSPYEIKPEFSIQGTLKQEQALHSSLRVAFARIRLPMPPNEWYPGNHPFTKEFLSNLKLGFDLGLSFLEQYNPAIKQPGKDRGGKSCFEPNYRWA